MIKQMEQWILLSAVVVVGGMFAVDYVSGLIEAESVRIAATIAAQN
ncbi:hypothetical protein Pan1_94 [Pseudanabaena phage Pan1]|nr:hypothetical protein Pan1_94 [Pseudanabaena phage Pan1]